VRAWDSGFRLSARVTARIRARVSAICWLRAQDIVRIRVRVRA